MELSPAAMSGSILLRSGSSRKAWESYRDLVEGGREERQREKKGKEEGE